MGSKSYNFREQYCSRNQIFSEAGQEINMQNSGQQCKNHSKFGVVFRPQFHDSVNGKARALMVTITAIKESRQGWALSVSAAVCEGCADQAAGQHSQLVISPSFYNLSPFHSPSAVPQLFLTTDIHLAGLLFPALSSDTLFFACPGWVQQNWFLFFFWGCFHFVFSPFVSRCPALTFLLLLLCSEEPALVSDWDLAAANFPLTPGHWD